MCPKIMIIGSDYTSDRFGAALARGIRNLNPQISLVGVGGPMMDEAGVHLLYDISDLVSLGAFQSVRGSQVVKRLIKKVAEAMDGEAPGLLIQIGLPLFEFRLLEIARSKDIPVVYYYTPFSRGLTDGKMADFARVVDKVFAISRYEAEMCSEIGIQNEFVGHPLLDLIDFSLTPAQARASLGLEDDSRRVIAVLPGSREAEVKNVLPTVLKALNRAETTQELEIIVSVAPTITSSLLERMISKCRCGSARLETDTYTILTAADLAVTSVGTASLEASLLGVPSLAVYRVPRTAQLVDRLLDRQPNMTITNNILRKTVIPEFIQSDFGAAEIGEAIISLLNDAEAKEEMLKEFERLQFELGGPGSVKRAASAAVEMIGCVRDGTNS